MLAALTPLIQTWLSWCMNSCNASCSDQWSHDRKPILSIINTPTPPLPPLLPVHANQSSKIRACKWTKYVCERWEEKAGRSCHCRASLRLKYDEDFYHGYMFLRPKIRIPSELLPNTIYRVTGSKTISAYRYLCSQCVCCHDAST